MAAQNNAPLPDGLELAGYRIVKKIASGGFSIVYLAYDPDGNTVAIKEYLPSALALRQPGELAPVISKPNQAEEGVIAICRYTIGATCHEVVCFGVRIITKFRHHIGVRGDIIQHAIVTPVVEGADVAVTKYASELPDRGHQAARA